MAVSSALHTGNSSTKSHMQSSPTCLSLLSVASVQAWHQL